MDRVIPCVGKRYDRIPATFDPNFHIPAFQFELGDAFVDDQIYKFFEFFLIHSYAVGRFPPARNDLRRGRTPGQLVPGHGAAN